MEEIGEGDAFFRDVLALLLDVDDVPDKPDATPAVSNSRVERKESRPKKKNAHRERLKAEMRALQRSAFALEDELRQLQQRKRSLVFPTGRESAQECWKRLAMQHKEALAQAKLRNHALKLEFRRRCIIIDKLQTLLRANAAHTVGLRRTSTDLATKGTKPQHLTHRAPVGSDNQVLFSVFFQELEEAYRAADRVLGESSLKLDSSEPKLLTIRPRMGLHGEEVLESTETISMPFSFERVKTDVWRIVSMLYPGQVDGLERPKDTLLGKVHVRGPDYELDIHFTMRRYLEDAHERMVTVWRTLTIGGGSFEGLDADETGWMLVRPKESSVYDEGVEATVMHSCVYFVPIFSVPHNDPKARHFTEVLLRVGDNDVMTVARMMEAMILHENSGSVGVSP